MNALPSLTFRTWSAVGLAGLAVPFFACVALTLLGVRVTGFGWLTPGPEAPQASGGAGSASVVQEAPTPAAGVLAGTFAELDDLWSLRSEPVVSAGLPHPPSCVEPSPGLSESRLYRVPGGETQVTVAAYPAGLGAEAFDRFHTGLDACRPAGVTVESTRIDDLGTQARSFDIAWADHAVYATVVRHGDVMVFVTTTDEAEQSTSVARGAERVLSARLTAEVCPDRDSGPHDALRNVVFAQERFTGRLRPHPLEPAAVAEEPELSAAQRAAGIVKVDPPGPAPSVPEVDRPERPGAYPVWPELPEEPEPPRAPEPPQPQRIEGSAYLRIADPEGPGCGWAFLATLEPPFDPDAVQRANEREIVEAQAALDADGPRWQAELVQYWTDHHAYLEEVEAWLDYAEEVEEVRRAWQEIAAEWEGFYRLFEIWAEREQEVEDFYREYDAARIAYNEQVDACTAYLGDPSAWPGGEPVPRCPPYRPGILDESPPEAFIRPAEPADPRPGR